MNISIYSDTHVKHVYPRGAAPQTNLYHKTCKESSLGKLTHPIFGVCTERKACVRKVERNTDFKTWHGLKFYDYP